MALLFNNKKQNQPRDMTRRTPRSNKSVYSYHSQRSERIDKLNRQPEEVDKNKQKRQKRKVFQHIPALILIILMLVVATYLSTLDGNVKIIIKDDKNTALRDSLVYQEAVTKFSNSSIVNRSKILFDNQGLIEHLKKQFPEISAVTVTMPLFARSPEIKIQTTRPSFILTSGQEAYLVGSNGVALINIRDIKDVSNLGLRTVNDESGISITSGKSAMPQEQALFIATVVEQLEKQGMIVDLLTIPNSPYDVHIKIKELNYFVKFNILEAPKQQVGSFIALKNKLDAEKITPKEYIDVRVGERVFYK